jgi:hypothetical protein
MYVAGAVAPCSSERSGLLVSNAGALTPAQETLVVTLPDGSIQLPDLGAPLAPNASRQVGINWTIPTGFPGRTAPRTPTGRARRPRPPA